MAEDDTVASFLGRLQLIVTQVESRGDKTFNEQAVVSKILCNLPSSFDMLIPAWRMQVDASKTLTNLTLQLLQTEGTLKTRADASVATAAAYVALAKGKKPDYTTEERAARRKEIEERKKHSPCWKCGDNGHWGRECTASEEVVKKYQETQAAKKEQSKKDQGGKGKNEGYKAFMAINSQSSCDARESNFSYVDSGCTEYMTETRSFFSTYRDISMEHRLVEGIGGVMLQAAGIGDIIIKIKQTEGYTFGVLKGVVHVPNLGRNLFSSYVAVQKKLYTLHMDTGCHLLEDGKVVMTGTVHNRMYRMQFEADLPEDTITAMSASTFGISTTAESRQSLEVWHRRFSHVNHATIQLMASHGLVDGLILHNKDRKFCP